MAVDQARQHRLPAAVDDLAGPQPGQAVGRAHGGDPVAGDGDRAGPVDRVPCVDGDDRAAREQQIAVRVFRSSHAAPSLAPGRGLGRASA
ncbi:hypothetical protein SCA03_05940 [Streptomyces cacaoi]|uniref:Uncharacterized protein n=1 Tax=Streptomyces cacaoi TaxID=1898 RepID=A0A4Y3QTS8_STRCI|nr:hypothetical protein SCA03_05940 [Streptomyces cacaoi]